MAKFAASDDGMLFACPGCRNLHWIRTSSARGPKGPDRAIWNFNGDMLAPTVSTSIVHRGWSRPNYEASAQPDDICHAEIANGEISFLWESSHSLRGQTVALPDEDEWGAILDG